MKPKYKPKDMFKWLDRELGTYLLGEIIEIKGNCYIYWIYNTITGIKDKHPGYDIQMLESITRRYKPSKLEKALY